MKIERLLGIVVYLLNRDFVNANTLAEKFEVSTKTIQRDIETLNLSGIPITSIQGVNGGYGILDSFKLDKQIASTEDYRFIITALMGMNSAYNNKKIETTLEKILSVSKQEKAINTKVKIDFSASREGKNIDEYIKIIENAIDKEKVIEFEYTNSYGDKTLREVEPIGVIYKWYAWYMLGYCCDKKDYRQFKLLRMRNLRKLDKVFSIKHENINDLLSKHEKRDNQKYVDIKILCKEEIRISIEEYFPNAKIIENEDDNFILQFQGVMNEVFWKALLFAYGSKIKIIEPEELKIEFMSKAKEIIDMYK
jgi:predicted DNA-binding transcriptional regulator YafY